MESKSSTRKSETKDSLKKDDDDSNKKKLSLKSLIKKKFILPSRLGKKSKNKKNKGIMSSQGRQKRNSVVSISTHEKETNIDNPIDESILMENIETKNNICDNDDDVELEPLQVLLDILGEHTINGVRKQDSVDLSDPSYQITSETLQEIHYMSNYGQNRKAMDTVTDMYLSFNHIDTLLP
jgi:hypothetical protein